LSGEHSAAVQRRPTDVNTSPSLVIDELFAAG
jgi:hypothetical protein